MSLLLVTMVDNAGVVRGKMTPHPDDGVARLGLSPVLNRYLVDDAIADPESEIGPIGAMWLVSDASARVPLTDEVTWAPAWQQSADGEPMPGCQRHFLQRQVEAAAGAGIVVAGGFELEWFAGRSDNTFLPRFCGPGYGAVTLVDASDYVVDLARGFEQADLGLRQLHAEYAPGQFELSLDPAPPLQLADNFVAARQLVHLVTGRHGGRASLAPVLPGQAVGNGAHLTLSFRRPDEPFVGPSGELSRFGGAIVAGLLAHLPALVAVGCGLSCSYSRLVPGKWACGYECWGWDNREAAVRLTRSTDDHVRVELKFPDCSANPYTLVGAAIAAALDGLARGLTAPEPVRQAPQLLEHPPSRLPTDIRAATAALRADQVLAQALGADLLDSLLATRLGEAQRADALEPDEDLGTVMWRL